MAGKVRNDREGVDYSMLSPPPQCEFMDPPLGLFLAGCTRDEKIRFLRFDSAHAENVSLCIAATILTKIVQSLVARVGGYTHDI